MTNTLQQLTPHVWNFPHNPDHTRTEASVGIVCTATQTVLVDAGNSRDHARRIQAALKTIDAPPIRHLIYTHNHWDHIFGAQVFNTAVIAHQLCAALVKGKASHQWGVDYIQQEIAKNPVRASAWEAILRAIDDWTDFEIVLPTIVFDTPTYTLQLDGLTLELEHVGGAHSPDSTTVLVKEEGVLFAGDCYYPLPGSSGQPDFDMLRRFAEAGYGWIVDSHSSPATHDELVTWLAENG